LRICPELKLQNRSQSKASSLLWAPRATGVFFTALTSKNSSDMLLNMKVTSRAFQRDFARMKAKARAGETVRILAGAEEFVFQAAKPRTWQGALKGKAKIKGDLFSTGLSWESTG
jgi:hypothetical protein